MESWVGTLLKDIKEKVVLSAPSSATINPLLSLLSKQSELEVASTTRTEKETVSSIDYFPFRLLPPELQLLINYVNQMRLIKTSHNLINILGRLLFLEHLASERASSAPCLEFDMSKMGHACITALLGERAWPPEGGYSFICWFQCVGLNSLQTEHRGTTKLRLFSVGSTNSENTFSEELYLQENGQLTLVINNTSQLSCPSLELEEGKWYHLAVVQSRKDSVAAEQFSGAVYTYLNGKLIDASELAYTPKRVEVELQITIGTPANNARVSDLKWRLRSCYLFIEPLSSEFIYFMYMLVRGCKVLRQGSNNSESNVSVDARGGIEKFVLLDSSSDSAIQMLETSGQLKTPEEDYSGIIKDLENLDKLWLELCGKKLLCAFNAARIEAMPTTQTLALLNLVDPELAIASPSDRGTTCVPCFGHLYGDVSICRRCIIGNVISPVTGIAIILALIEHAETSNMLHLALTLLASTLHRNYHAVQHMKACHGYHLLSLFLQRKKSLFDSQCLDILFKIAVSEDPLKPSHSQTTSRTEVMPLITSPEPYTIDQDNLSTAEYDENLHCFSKNGETSSHEFQPLANSVAASSFSGALSDADILEHVLLDWTLWLTLPVSFQLKILNFFENLISVYMYKDHNLTVLRERNIVQHLLAGLHRDDFEVLVLEKLITLLAIIIEHKFLGSELESVTNFVLTTFKPPEVMKPHQVTRETKSMRVTVRNILLETLIDLQVTICSEELLEQWHTLVSSKLVTYFLDESVHPTSMIWIITFLGLCLTSSATFALKFENGEGYQALARVLPSFRDFLDIRYTLFCLIFGKPIYPKLPEVGVLDFEALMLNSEDFGNLRFAGLLDSVVSMVKSVFDQLRVQPKIAGQSVNPSETSAVDLVEGDTDTIEELGEECSMNKMHDTSLLGWEASAVDATSVLKLMANLAKMSPSFSRICARTEFLEICVDLYFSIVRAYMAFKLTKEHNVPTSTNYAILDIEGNELPSTTSDSQTTSSEDSGFLTTSHLLLEIDNSGHSGETTSVGATTILDLIAEVLSVIMIEHANPVAIMEDLLGSVPLYLDSESALTFQALCLGRVMNYLERRLLYGDEKTGQSFDKNKLWSNLGSFCNLIVDRVYLGVFPQPSAVLRVLEFCLSMLHSAKKDSKIEESSLPWTGLLSVLRGSKPLDIILECTNRMILYCFLPSLPTIRENPLILQDERRVNISIVLELIHAHKDIIFHPGNVNTDLYCSLCINLIGLLSDEQTEARNAAMSILKYLLVHCRASLQEVLISKAENRKTADVLNGGFDKLLTENTSTFLTWFQNNEHDIKHVLQQYASIRWSHFIAESEKFRRDRMVSLEDHWTAKMGGKVELASKVDRMYWVQYMERRSTLAAIQSSVCTEFDVLYQKKNELVVHAESEWRSRFEQLGHEHKNDLISSLVWEDYWPL